MESIPRSETSCCSFYQIKQPTDSTRRGLWCFDWVASSLTWTGVCLWLFSCNLGLHWVLSQIDWLVDWQLQSDCDSSRIFNFFIVNVIIIIIILFDGRSPDNRLRRKCFQRRVGRLLRHGIWFTAANSCGKFHRQIPSHCSLPGTLPRKSRHPRRQESRMSCWWTAWLENRTGSWCSP